LAQYHQPIAYEIDVRELAVEELAMGEIDR
jgi:hypothetical protein